MDPNTSPNSSLKNGPSASAGRVWRMSPTFFLTWYQMSGTSFGAAVSSNSRMISDSPGLE